MRDGGERWSAFESLNELRQRSAEWFDVRSYEKYVEARYATNAACDAERSCLWRRERAFAREGPVQRWLRQREMRPAAVR